MGTLSGNIQKARHELGVLAQIDPAEAGNACAAVRMDVEDSDSVRQRPLHRIADGRRAHHHGDGVVTNVVIVRHRTIALRQKYKPVAAACNSGRDKPYSLGGKRVRALQISPNGGEESSCNLEAHVHDAAQTTERRWAHSISRQGRVGTT